MFCSTLNTFAQWSVTGNASTNPPTNYLGTTDAKDLVIKTNAVERLRVLNTNGNVGIGTTAPASKFEVRNACATTGIDAFILTNDMACITGTSTGNLMLARTYNTASTVTTNRFVLDNNGRTGINLGATAPAAQLDVQTSSSSIPTLQLRNTSGTAMFAVLNSGNAGIGTVTPAARLEVRNASSGTNPLQVYNAASGNIFTMKDNGQIGIIQTTLSAMLDIKNNTANDDFRILDVSGNTHLIIQNAGNVGIGVSNPTAYGGSLVVGVQGTGANALDLVSTATTGWCNQLRFDAASGPRHIIVDDRTTNTLTIDPGYGGGAKDTVKVTGSAYITGNTYIDGKLRIGAKTITGTHSDAKLFVEGKVAAQSFVVTMSNWADKVFRNDYTLRTLAEVEAYIKANKHLPDIPTEKEVIEQGVSLGEINTLLLQKIEELTLYTIKQQKDIEGLKEVLTTISKK